MKKVKIVKNVRGYKKMQCKYCERISERVDANATAVTCWKCTHRLCEGEKLELRK
jgi:ribosomal protein S27E